MKYLHVRSVIACTVCPGRLVLSPPGSPAASQRKSATLTEDVLRRATVVGCTQYGPGRKPCTRVVSVVRGPCNVFHVRKQRVIKADVEIITDGSPPQRHRLKSDGGAVMQTDERKGWIDLQVLDDAGEPLADERYRLELPDGSVQEGTTDSEGRVKVDGLKPAALGKIRFPDLEPEEEDAGSEETTDSADEDAETTSDDDAGGGDQAPPASQDAPASSRGRFRTERYPPFSLKARNLFKQAAKLAGVPESWAEDPGLHNILARESDGWVGRPNYTYGARATNQALWGSVIDELRRGQKTTTSSATGLGQLLLSNVDRYYPAGRSGLGDPLQEAAGMLAYIKAAYGTPGNAWRQYGKQHEGY
jgi:hypothetical protein